LGEIVFWYGDSQVYKLEEIFNTMGYLSLKFNITLSPVPIPKLYLQQKNPLWAQKGARLAQMLFFCFRLVPSSRTEFVQC